MIYQFISVLKQDCIIAQKVSLCKISLICIFIGFNNTGTPVLSSILMRKYMTCQISHGLNSCSSFKIIQFTPVSLIKEWQYHPAYIR